MLKAKVWLMWFYRYQVKLLLLSFSVYCYTANSHKGYRRCRKAQAYISCVTCYGGLISARVGPMCVNCGILGKYCFLGYHHTALGLGKPAVKAVFITLRGGQAFKLAFLISGCALGINHAARGSKVTVYASGTSPPTYVQCA